MGLRLRRHCQECRARPVGQPACRVSASASQRLDWQRRERAAAKGGRSRL